MSNAATCPLNEPLVEISGSMPRQSKQIDRVVMVMRPSKDLPGRGGAHDMLRLFSQSVSGVSACRYNISIG